MLGRVGTSYRAFRLFAARQHPGKRTLFAPLAQIILNDVVRNHFEKTIERAIMMDLECAQGAAVFTAQPQVNILNQVVRRTRRIHAL